MPARRTTAALTVWEGRISPVFDVSRVAEVLVIENGAVTARRRESIDTPTAELKIDWLVRLGVETLICGAISAPLRRELTTRGVHVLGFVAGDLDEVVAGFLAGALPTAALSMPGCCGRPRRLHGGCGPGRGRAGRGGGPGRARGGGWGRRQRQ
jgi:predicted Fe-Mo cluster-binding NifX family protein